MKTCPSCGALNEDAAIQCTSCGVPLAQAPEQSPVLTLPEEEQALPPESPGTKRSKKKLWIGLGSAAGLLVIAAVVLAVLFFNRPLGKVLAAANHTVQLLTQELEPLENAAAAWRSMEDLNEAGAYTTQATVGLPLLQGRGYLTLDADYDGIQRRTAVALAFGVEEAGEIRAQLYLTPEDVSACVPQLWPEQVFCATGEELAAAVNESAGEELLSPDSFAQLVPEPGADVPLLEQYEAACGEELTAYLRSLDAQRLSRQDEDASWTYYQLTSNPEKRRALLEGTARFLKENSNMLQSAAMSVTDDTAQWEAAVDAWIDRLDSWQDPTVAVDGRGRLVCLELTDGIDVYTFRLTGAEKLWQSYSLSVNAEPVLTGGIWVESGVLTWQNTVVGGEQTPQESFTLTYQDQDGAYRLCIQDDTLFSGSLRREAEGDVSFTMEIFPEEDDSFSLSYSLLPLRQAPEKLPGQEVDLLHLSDGAKQELSAAAVQQALGDEDVMGLLGLFLGLGY